MTLDEIRKLIDAATPGPWWNELWDVHSSRVHICEAQTTGAEIEPAPVKDTFVFHEDGRVTTMGGSQLADISQEEAEAKYLRQFMPAQMSADEIKALVTATIAETGAAGAKDLGKVMKALQPKIAGKADGKLVNQVVRDSLGA